MNTKKGFTLIEMTFTVSIIGIICIFLVGYLYNQHRKADTQMKASKFVNQISDLIAAQDRFYLSNGYYGTKLEIVESGIIKQWPEPDQALADTECLLKNNQIFEFSYISEDLVGTPEQELLISLSCVKQEFKDIVLDIMADGTTDNNLKPPTTEVSTGEGSTGTAGDPDGVLNGESDPNTTNNKWVFTWSSCNSDFLKIGTPKCFDPDNAGFVSADFCEGEKPTIAEEACPMTVEWKIKEWSDPMYQWSAAYHRRSVWCQNTNGLVLPDTYCNSAFNEESPINSVRWDSNTAEYFYSGYPVTWLVNNFWSSCLYGDSESIRGLYCWSTRSTYRGNSTYCSSRIPEDKKPATSRSCDQVVPKILQGVNINGYCDDNNLTQISSVSCYEDVGGYLQVIGSSFCRHLQTINVGDKIPCPSN